MSCNIESRIRHRERAEEAACSACCGPSAGYINTQRCVSLPCQGNIPGQDCSEYREAPHWPKMELQWNEGFIRVVQVPLNWIEKSQQRFKLKSIARLYERNVEKGKNWCVLETQRVTNSFHIRVLFIFFPPVSTEQSTSLILVSM